jgi:hypothetical protein
MAQRTHALLTDDLDGSPGAETVHFALDGVDYEIDLNEQHVRELRSVLDPYIKAGRRLGGRTRRRGGGAAS